MKRMSVALLGILPFLFPLLAQTGAVKVKLRVILVDKDLNQKPVPFFSVVLRNANGSGAAIEMKTGLDGTVQQAVAPGRYALSTPKPVELGGKRFRWEQEITVAGTEQNIELTNDNAKAEEVAASGAPAAGGDLTQQFQHLKNSVLTIWSESGHGTGFFVDPAGLVLTNQHVVSSSEYLAAQFDPQRKVQARLVAADAQKDIALLWVNPGAFSEAVMAPLVKPEVGKPPVAEGERVFTIGSPLTLQKILTTGVVSKVEPHTIISDININPGNSGGPLFNAAGTVVGLTTFGTRGSGGPGVSGIVRIEEAITLIEQNRAKLSGAPPPAALLPVEPEKSFPIEGLTPVLQIEKYDSTPYYWSQGDFEVGLSTPPLDFRESQEGRLKAEKERAKRNKKKGGEASGNPSDAQTPKNWEAEAGERKAVIGIFVIPKAKEGFWSSLGRNMAASRGMYGGPAKLKFKTDFYRMQLLCGEKEVQPIHPGKLPAVVAIRNAAINMTDSTAVGQYVYPPDAISPACGQSVLQIYPTKDNAQPIVKVLEAKTVERVWGDFEAYRKAQGTVGQNTRPEKH